MLLQPALDLSFWPEKVSSFLQRNQITIRSWLSTLSYTSLIVLFSLVNLISFRLNLVLLEIDTLLELKRLLALSSFFCLFYLKFYYIYILENIICLFWISLKKYFLWKLYWLHKRWTDLFRFIKNWFYVNIWYLMRERLCVFALRVIKLIEQNFCDY